MMRIAVLAAILMWNLGCIEVKGVGPPGEPGPQGEPGVQGPQGPKGDPFFVGAMLGPGIVGDGGVTTPFALESRSAAPSSNGSYAFGPRLTGLWTRRPGVALQSDGGFDSANIFAGSVVKLNTNYLLFYAGYNGTQWAGIGVAKRPTNDTPWVRNSAPILNADLGSGWTHDLIDAWVVANPGESFVRMYISGRDTTGRGVIGLSTSTDSEARAFSTPNPVLLPTAATWDAATVEYCSVIRDSGGFTMWYSGHSGDGKYRIGRAVSMDATSGWRKDPPTPVLDVGPAGAWDSNEVLRPRVLKIGRMYYMLYTGSNGKNQIGMATSPDGVTWTKAPFNPVVSLVPGTFQSNHVSAASVLVDGEEINLWVNGHDGTKWQVGAFLQEAL